jgi:uncharacterized membrane protein
MPRLARILAVAAIVAAATLLGARLASAQGRSLVWDRWVVNLDVQTSGDVHLEEIQTVTFQGGTFTRGFHRMPLDRIGKVETVEFGELGRPYSPGSGQPYTYNARREGDEYVLEWHFPATSGQHTYTWRYVIDGVIRRYEQGDQLWWKAVRADRDFPVREAEVSIRLPDVAGIHQAQVYINPTGGGQADEPTPEGEQRVLFAARNLRPGAEMEVRVEFTPGVVGGAEPAWQAQFDRQRAGEQAQIEAGRGITPWQALLTLLVIVASLGLLVGGSVGMYILWHARGRDSPPGVVATYLSEPPDQMAPAEVGTLLDETADMKEVIATLVDLARRGVVTIEEEREAGFLRFGESRDLVLRRLEAPADLKRHEWLLLKALFDGRTTTRLSDHKEKFYSDVSAIQEALYARLVAAKLFEDSPHAVRNRYLILGLGGLALSILGGLPLSGVGSVVTPALLCLPVVLGLLSIGMLILSRFMPRKTRLGADEAARWRAFRNYLDGIESYTDLRAAHEVFDRYLPYAIAMGLEQSWIDKFARVGTPAPEWYQPWVGDGDLGGPRRAGRGASAPIGRASRPVPRSERSAPPTLQRTSESMGRSLQSMSAGLGSMLTLASQVFSSRPSSSGGSGSGWSGGGFSGGGGSGGGSSGFG